MGLTTSMMNVAGRDCPPQVATVLASTGLPPFGGTDNVVLPLSAREVKKMPAADAEQRVRYLADAQLSELFAIDRRKGVRWQVCLQWRRLDATTAAAAYLWTVDDGIAGHHETLEGLASKTPVETLVEVSQRVTDVTLWAVTARAIAVQARDAAHLRELVDQVFGTKVYRPLLRDAVCGDCANVTIDEALELLDDQGILVMDLLTERRELNVPTVLRALEDGQYRQAVQHWANHQTMRRMSSGVREALVTELSGDRWAAALDLWDVLGVDVFYALEHVDESQAATMTTTAARKLAMGNSVTTHWRHLAEMYLVDHAGEDDNYPVAKLVDHLVNRCEDPEVLAHALDTLEDTRSTELAERLSRRQWSTKSKCYAALRHRLLGSGAKAETRAELLDATCDPQDCDQVAAEVAEVLERDSYSRDARVQAERILAHVPVREDLRVRLALKCNSYRWLSVGSSANEVTDEVLSEVVRRTTVCRELVNLLRSIEQPERAVDAFVEQAAKYRELAEAVWEKLTLTADHTRTLLACWPLADTALKGSVANPLTHELRAQALEVGGWNYRVLAESFGQLAPREDEREVMMATFSPEHTATAGEAEVAATVLVRHVELRRDELEAALRAAPGAVSTWVHGTVTTGECANAYDPELFDELLEELAQSPRCDLVAVAGEAARTETGRRVLAESRQFLHGAQGEATHYGGGRSQPVRIVWELCHEALGDDVVAWNQLVAQLDNWPGTLASLLAVCKAVSA